MTDLERRAARLVFPAYRFEEPESDALELAREGVGGFCLYGGRAEDWCRLVRKLEAEAPAPLLLCADFEDGAGQWIPDMVRLPSNMAVGASGSPELARAKGRAIAEQANRLGVHLPLVPVVDLNTNPKNPIINIRSFGEDPERVAELAGALIDGLHERGVLSCLKHFPGHGDVDLDSHLDLPAVDHESDRLARVELVPFRRLAGRTDAVMTAHLLVRRLDSELPASLSPAVTTNVLRRQIGFDGLIVTDALSMGGVAGFSEEEVLLRALRAGADVLLCPRDPRRAIATLAAAVRAGRLDGAVLDRARERIDRARRRAEGRGPSDLDVKAVAGEIAEASVAVLRAGGPSLPVRGPVEVRVVGQAATEDLVRELGDVRADAPILIAVLGARPKAFSGSLEVGNAALRGIRAQIELNRHVIALALGSPYALAELPEARTAVCAWSDCPASQIAAAKVIRGRIPPRGRSPVRL